MKFSKNILAWFDEHGRKHLPWQTPRNPYRVWISEIMLQQTQVRTVIPYFERFIDRFPDVQHLAHADQEDVMAFWAGLGYYARARNLKKAAEQIVHVHQGLFPDDLESLERLPGIGRSTAGAILSLGFGKRAAILDGNVKRVLARHAGIEGWPGHSRTLHALWEVSEARTPRERFDHYNQAMMDLGAMVCTARRPACGNCPVHQDCTAFHQSTQEALPSPRPPRQIPVRECWMLILLQSPDAIFLERRPDHGIWGGLMSLPEFVSLAALEDWCHRNNTGRMDRHWVAPKRRHTFSHYHLDFVPVMVEWKDAEVLPACDGRWVPRDELSGLPAPIEKLLKDPKTFQPPPTENPSR